MNDGQEKVIVLTEIGLNPVNAQRPVGVPVLLDDKSNSVGAFFAQRSCQEVRPIVQFPGSCMDPLPRALRNGPRRRGIVQDRRDSASRQADMFRDFFQRDSSRRSRLFPFSHSPGLSPPALLSAPKLAYRTKTKQLAIRARQLSLGTRRPGFVESARSPFSLLWRIHEERICYIPQP